MDQGTSLKTLIPILAFVTAAVVSTNAGPWPGWRGPEGSGVYQGKPPPLHWSTNENVRWRVPLPEPGNSTPIIWGDRVFVTQAVELRRTVMCFNRRDGKLLWQAGPTWTEKEISYPENPPCTPSPVTDGKLVIAWFGSAGVYCFDFDEHELWHRDLGRQSHTWGYAASPVLYRDACFINFGPGPGSSVVALDKRTGKTLWQQSPPVVSAEAKWEEFGGDSKYMEKPGALSVSDVAGSWATPLIVPAGGRDELVVAFALHLMAFAPKTGKHLWTCDEPNIGIYSSPFFGEGLVGLNGNGLRNTLVVVRPGGRGKVTTTRQLWMQYAGNSKGCIGAGVISGGHIYQVNVQGFAECRELKTGEIVWEERLTGTGARNASWSSPVLTGELLYTVNRNADVFVLRARPQFACLATNSIGSEPMNASLAISDGEVFLRTEKNLWCFGENTPVRP